MDHALADEVLSGNVWADQVSSSPDPDPNSPVLDPDLHQGIANEDNSLNDTTGSSKSIDHVEKEPGDGFAGGQPPAPPWLCEASTNASGNETHNLEGNKLESEVFDETVEGFESNGSFNSAVTSSGYENLTVNTNSESDIPGLSSVVEVQNANGSDKEEVNPTATPQCEIGVSEDVLPKTGTSTPKEAEVASRQSSQSEQSAQSETILSEDTAQEKKIDTNTSTSKVTSPQSPRSGPRGSGCVYPENPNNDDDDDDFADFEEYHEDADTPVINTSKILSDIWPEPLLHDQIPEQIAILDVTSASNTYTNPRKLMNQITRPMRQFVAVESKPDPIVRWRASAVEGEVLRILQHWREREFKRSRNRLFGWSHKRSSSLGPQKKDESNTTNSNNATAPLARVKRTTNPRPSSVVVEPAHYLSSPTVSGPNSARTSPGIGSNSSTFDSAFAGAAVDKTFSSSSPIDSEVPSHKTVPIDTKPASPLATTHTGGSIDNAFAKHLSGPTTPIESTLAKPKSPLSTTHTGGSIDNAFAKHLSGPTTPIESTFAKPKSPLSTTHTGGSIDNAFSKPPERPISSTSTGPKFTSGPTTPIDSAFPKPPGRPVSSASIDEMFGMTNSSKPSATNTRSTSMTNSIDEVFGQPATSSANSIDEAFGVIPSPTSPKIPLPSTMTAQFTNRSQMKPAPALQPPTNNDNNDDDDDFGDFEQSQPPPPPPSQPPVTLGPIQPTVKQEQQNDSEKVNSIVNSLPDLSFLLN